MVRFHFFWIFQKFYKKVYEITFCTHFYKLFTPIIQYNNYYIQYQIFCKTEKSYFESYQSDQFDQSDQNLPLPKLYELMISKGRCFKVQALYQIKIPVSYTSYFPYWVYNLNPKTLIGNPTDNWFGADGLLTEAVAFAILVSLFFLLNFFFFI